MDNLIALTLLASSLLVFVTLGVNSCALLALVCLLQSRHREESWERAFFAGQEAPALPGPHDFSD